MNQKDKVAPSYRELAEAINNDQDELIVKLADQFLHVNADDNEAKHCKVVALLKLSKFDQLPDYFKSGKFMPNDMLRYAYGYYLYKTQKYEECLAYIKSGLGKIDDNSLKQALLLLDAQIKYRTNKYAESVDIYIKILSNTELNEDNVEIMVNLVNSVILWGKKVPDAVLKLADGFINQNQNDLIREFYFNLSLLYAHCSDYQSSRKMLNFFKKIVEAEAAEDATLESDNDLLIYQLQLDYINSLQYEYTEEESEERVKIYQSRLEQRIEEQYKILIKNNLVCYRDKQKDFTDSLRKLDEIIQKAPSVKYTKAQILNFQVNKLILYITRNKYHESIKLIDEIESKYTQDEYFSNEKFIASKFFLLFRTKKYKEIEILYSQLLSIFGDNYDLNSKALLTTILMNAEINRIFNQQKSLMGNLRVLYTKYSRMKQCDPLHAFIVTTVSNNLNLASDFQDIIEDILSNSKNPQVLSLVAELFIRTKNYEKAIKIYQKIYDLDANNMKALERLAYLYSFFDLKKAESFLKKIPPIDMIIEPEEIKKLESDYLPARSSKFVEEHKKSELQDRSKKIKKRKRRPRYPKNFDPANPGPMPDPERWLPKFEKTKNKKLLKKKGLLRGPQGGAAGKETTSNFKSGPSTANQEVSTSKSQAKKKKKK
eukprot:CAMPEP_0176442626 /NCGR_PEP_ID=MMETSP0127-20121128/21932_1 /TAXON_ID=938130 /ORGANISM="Platyophrya macrostoma, Strain WH" /LENGTH=655 /DNA_ID=CAMNT_0017827685 /DNA_START=23 /DNA_END=1993 /DNA_ORIENTATION=-